MFDDRFLRRELVSLIIERIQRIRMNRTYPYIEPEVQSPKVIYQVEDILNQTFINRDEVPLVMDIFKPVVEEEKELPVIIFLHGGGLVVGSRKMARHYCRALASRGYLVFCPEYRHAPRANSCEQLDDVCAGMDFIGRKLVEFNVDLTRIFLAATSAGAYLGIYVAAMKRSVKLQEAIGYKPTNMVFKAIALFSGMFYTNRDDPIGWLLADQIYGERMADENFLQYMNPEHEEIIKNLPAALLVTSRGDYLNNYTLMYHEALKKANRKSRLLYYGDGNLSHGFASMDSHLAASIDVMDKMVDWFEEQVVLVREDEERKKVEKEAYSEIWDRICSGEIIEQKVWKYIKELNSYSRDKLDAVALVDVSRDYSYRQMFQLWDQYARVFSALGMTGEDRTRVLMRGLPSVEIVCSLFALNMTGASVSLHLEMDSNDYDRLKAMVEVENIRDLLIPDLNLKKQYLRQIMKDKEELGIRHVIVVHIPQKENWLAPCGKEESMRRYEELKEIKGLLFMDDLLDKYQETPICYGQEQCVDDALITHTSGTTTGTRKPIPLSDRGANETSRRLLVDEDLEHMKGRMVSCLSFGLGSAYALYDELMVPLAAGGRVVLLPASGFSLKSLRSLSHYHANVFFGGPMILEELMKIPFLPDLSDMELVFLGGSYTSADAKKRYNEYLRKCGSKAKVTIGYGLSEAGGACILSSPDREDDAIGFPMDGIKIKLYDEDEKRFYDLSDGPRTGVMYMNSPSVSCGRMDDKVLFELEEIDGEPYLNTYDLVRVDEEGAFYYVGRMNQYFVNNDGVRFDAGLVERAVSAQPKIESCGMTAGYGKALRDTIPVLYVKPVGPAEYARRTVKDALVGAFIKDHAIKDSNLPVECVITDEIPYNASGKVDGLQIATGQVEGYRYRVLPVRHEGVLTDIILKPYRSGFFEPVGLPDELDQGR